MEKRLRNLDDAYGWSKETAQALRAGNFAAIDMDELIDQIESIASGLRRELVSTLRDVIEALLILSYTTGDEKEARRQLVFSQGQLRLLLNSTPSIKEAVPDAISEAYEWGSGLGSRRLRSQSAGSVPNRAGTYHGEPIRKACSREKARMIFAEEFFVEMSKTDKRELENRLYVLISHLLKIEHVTGQVGARDLHGWSKTVRAQRDEIGKLCLRHPSLRPDLTDWLADKVYLEAVANLEDEYPGIAFPRSRNLTMQDILGSASA